MKQKVVRTFRAVVVAVGFLTIHFAGTRTQGAVATALDELAQAHALAQHRISVKSLNLSRTPETDELIAAGQLGGPLVPTHELKDKRREDAAKLDFGKAIEEWNKHEYPKAVALFRKHAKEISDSPWAAEAILHIGCDATYDGRYAEAEPIFRKLIADHHGKEHAGAKLMLNKARQRLALVKVEQNNLDAAGELFRELQQESPDWRHRTYAAHWLQRLSRLAAAKQALLNCGAEALAYALENEGRHEAAAKVRGQIPETMRGHSLGDLVKLAATHNYHLSAINITTADLPRLPLPAILHIQAGHAGDKGHYWVLDRVQGDRVELFDPQSRRRFHQTIEELAKLRHAKTCLPFCALY